MQQHAHALARIKVTQETELPIQLADALAIAMDEGEIIVRAFLRELLPLLLDKSRLLQRRRSFIQPGEKGVLFLPLQQSRSQSGGLLGERHEFQLGTRRGAQLQPHEESVQFARMRTPRVEQQIPLTVN